MSAQGRQDAEYGYRRDMNVELQKVIITRPEGPQGEFMRSINEEESKKLSEQFESKN